MGVEDTVMMMRRRRRTLMREPSLIETGRLGKKMAYEMRRWVYHYGHGMKQH